MEASEQVTQLLLRCRSGDRSALEELTPLVYQQLRILAAGLFRSERTDHTLQATALVHEAYLKLADQSRLTWQSRAHFFAIAARVMRQILVDHSRQHRAQKRGGGDIKVQVDENTPAISGDSDLGALDDALIALEKLDPRKARAIELRYFAGMTSEEIAEAIGVSVPTVNRDLRMAQSWLYLELKRSGDNSAAGNP